MISNGSVTSDIHRVPKLVAPMLQARVIRLPG